MKKMRFSKKIALLVAMVMILSVAWMMPTFSAGEQVLNAGTAAGTLVYNSSASEGSITVAGTLTIADSGSTAIPTADGQVQLAWSTDGGTTKTSFGSALTPTAGVFTLTGSYAVPAATPAGTSYTIWATYSGSSYPVLETSYQIGSAITVGKATPSLVTAPSVTPTGWAPNTTLADYALSGGTVDIVGCTGHWEWVDPTEDVTDATFATSGVKFVPDDTDNYNGFTAPYTLVLGTYALTDADVNDYYSLLNVIYYSDYYNGGTYQDFLDEINLVDGGREWATISLVGVSSTDPVQAGRNPFTINIVVADTTNYDTSGVSSALKNYNLTVDGLGYVPVDVSNLTIDTSNGVVDQGGYYEVPFGTTQTITVDVAVADAGTPQGLIRFNIQDQNDWSNEWDLGDVAIDTATGTATLNVDFSTVPIISNQYTITASYAPYSPDDPYFYGTKGTTNIEVIPGTFTDYPDVAAVPYGWTLDKAVRFTASNPLDLDNSTFSLFQEPDAATVGTLVWDTPDIEPLYDPTLTSIAACPTYLMDFVPADANYNMGTDNVPVLTLPPMFEGLGYDGVVNLKVGESSVFIPTKDDQVGGNGWALSNAAVGNLTFNSPATFHATAVGTTKITFTTAEGYVMEATINVAAAGSSSTSGSSTGDNTPLFLIIGAGMLALIAAGVVTLKKVKATK